MNYNEAIKIKNKNNHLIGFKYRGEMIDEIILCPSNRPDFLKFSKVYMNCLNAEIALKPYINGDIAIIAVMNKERIRFDAMFSQTEIINLRDEGLKVHTKT